MCLAIFFALFCRANGKDREAAEFIDDDQDLLNADDEEYLHMDEVNEAGEIRIDARI